VILTGDIGGTHTRLATFEVREGRPALRAVEIYPSGRFGGLEEILLRFRREVAGTFERAAFGVAGPLRGRAVVTTNLPWVADATAAMEAGDPAAAVPAAAERQDPVCLRALDLFASAYAAEAGNLALRLLATGGVFLGGGIAPRILPWLRRPSFREAFADKGRLRALLEDVPIHVVLDDRAGLVGAARRALEEIG